MDKTQELAQTDEDLANAKHDKELTTKALETDQVTRGESLQATKFKSAIISQ